MMFRVIGGIVVYGLALYGVAKLLGCRTGVGKVESGNKPDDQHHSAPTGTDRPTNEPPAGMDVDSTQAGG